MKYAKVIGKVWAEKKVEELYACRLLVVQPMSSSGEKSGNPLVAADPQNLAGNGDDVVIVTSTDATEAFDSGYAPVNASIVELVDSVS